MKKTILITGATSGIGEAAARNSDAGERYRLVCKTANIICFEYKNI